MSIKELFDKRNQSYTEQTQLILESIPHVLEGVVQALGSDGGTEITWQDIQIMPTDDLVVLTGTIGLQPGEVVKKDQGDTIVITEDNVKDYQRLLRVGIPLMLVENGTIEEITQFFADNKNKNYQSINELDFVNDEIPEDDELLQKQVLDSITGFDLDDLDDEQIIQMISNLDEGKIH